MAYAVYSTPMSKGVHKFMRELRAFIKARDDNQSKAAVELNLTPQFLCDILKQRRPVPPKLAKQFGYSWDLVKQ